MALSSGTEINGKVAFITGGANGIGLAVAQELLHNGAKRVAIVDINKAALEEAFKLLTKKFGCRFTIIQANVANVKELEDAMVKTIRLFKTIDIVFNNAGVVNEIEWERTLDINLKAVAAGTYLSYKYMGKHNGGKGGIVINTASAAVFYNFGGVPIYSTSKSGVLGLGRAFGHSFHYNRSGVKVLTVCPSATGTNIFTNVRIPDEELEYHLAETRILQYQSSEDVAKHIVNIINKGENGSVWFIEANKAYKIRFPTLKELKKTEMLLQSNL